MDYEDLKFRPSSQDDSPIILPEPPDQSRNIAKLAAAAVLLIAVGVTGYLLFRDRQAAPPETAPAAAPAPAPDTTQALGPDVPAIDLPPLNETDDVVRGLVRELTANPSVTAWLMTDNLIRNFTVVVSNIAAGNPASRQVAVLRPKGSFQIDEKGEDLFISPNGYARYLSLATAATSINPEDAAKLYASLKPRIDDAYAELGQPGTTFDETLERAIVVLLRTPMPKGRVSVQPNGAFAYRFADPALEKLTPEQKLLIRLGPDNQRTVQTSLRNIALALGIPPERLP